jgi:hypothetical protein
MDIKSIGEIVATIKSAIDLLKSAATLLPTGKDREKIERQLTEAVALLARSDAKLAHELGYQLHRCTFPPQIMVLNKEDMWVCPSCDKQDDGMPATII